MIDAIVISYDPFAKESRVMIMKDGMKTQVNVCSSLSELETEIMSLSYKYNIYVVKFHAPSMIIEEMSNRIKAIDANFEIEEI